MRGCYFKQICDDIDSIISTGLFKSVTLKGILYGYGADVNPVSPAEEGGLVAVLLVLLYF